MKYSQTNSNGNTESLEGTMQEILDFRNILNFFVGERNILDKTTKWIDGNKKDFGLLMDILDVKSGEELINISHKVKWEQVS